MPGEREADIRQNFHYFQGIVGGLMARHAGEYALLRSRSVVGIYPRPIEALEAGYSQFEDGQFSVQKVIDRPLDLGFMSYGSGDRVSD
jgi:hypothetical protein